MRDDGDKYAMMTERQSEEGKCKVANMQTGLGTNYIIKAMKSESLHRATGRFTLPRNRECNSSEAVTSYPLELTLANHFSMEECRGGWGVAVGSIGCCILRFG